MRSFDDLAENEVLALAIAKRRSIAFSCSTLCVERFGLKLP